MRLITTLALILIPLVAKSQELPAYELFNAEGKKSDYGKMVKEALKADVIFFGELHDNPIAHWLELELTKDLYKEKNKDLVMAAEMFETDNQILIDEYFQGIIKESSFENEVRLWTNYITDYKPLLDYAKTNNLRFVASNIPRRYASVVASGGFDALKKLSVEALTWIAPLPVEYDPELQCYKDMLSMGGQPGSPMAKSVNENLPKAQAIKDATMAWSIVKNLKQSQSLIHFNGSYHSDRYMGILWYLNKYRPGLKIVTITTLVQDNIEKIDDESKGKADFIIVIPSSMTRTYRGAGQ